MTYHEKIPLDEADIKFAEPWQAQVFALTLHLHQQGLFSWTQWAEHLSKSIKNDTTESIENYTTAYYLQWLNALEEICMLKTGLTSTQLLDKRNAWETAYLHTPHGKAISLHT